MKVLLTSTSFQDSDGFHKQRLNEQGWEVSYLRGPLKKAEIIDVIASFDALICGDDDLDEEVLKTGVQGRLKYISKYGVGLDKIDLAAAKSLGIPVTNCQGVNQEAVAEHVLALVFSYFKNIHISYVSTSEGKWLRPVGRELGGKTLGIVGLGAIGKELAIRARALGMRVSVFDVAINRQFVEAHGLKIVESLESLFSHSDVISLHVPLTHETEGLITSNLLASSKRGMVLVNTARAGLLFDEDVVNALQSGKLGGYLTDVLSEEPMESSCILRGQPGVVITPHIGSRTQETIERQGTKAVENLISLCSNEETNS